MRRAAARGLLALAVLSVAGLAQAQAPGLEVSAPGADTLYVSPGATVGFGVRVEAAADRTVGLAVAPPDGWTPLLTRPELAVTAGRPALQIVSVRVPETAAPAVYPVAVTVAGGGEAATVRRFVRVASVAAITVEIVGAPRYVVAGDRYTATAVVTNLGNATALVDLRTRTTYRHRVRAEADRVEVAPGGTASVALEVATEEPPGAVTDRLRVIAVDRAAADTTAAGAWDDATARVQVVPLAGRTVEDETWPLTTTVSSVSVGEAVVPRIGVLGAVSFDAEGRHRAEVLLDEIGPASASIFGGVPQAWVRYQGPTVGAEAGRGLFRLSPAATSAAFGLGARATAERGDLDAALQLRRSVRSRGIDGTVAVPLDTDLGASVGRTLGATRLSANAIAGWGYRPGLVATGRVETVARGVTLDAEAGLVPRVLAAVWSVRASGAVGPLALHGAARHHAAEQPGRSVDFEGHSAGAVLDLDDLSVSALWSGQRRGLGRGGVDVGADREASGFLTARYAFPYGDAQVRVEGGGEYRAYERERSFGGARARSTALARSQVTVTGSDRTRFTAELRRGRSWDPTTGLAQPAWGLRLLSGYSEARWGLAWNVEVLKGLGDLGSAPPRRVSTGADGYWNRGALEVRGRIRGGHVDVQSLDGAPLFRSATASVQADAQLALPGDRALIARTYVYWGRDRPEVHLQATVRVALGMPLPYAVERPEVRGRFVDQGTGEGVEGVLVFFGADRVVTDRDGTFRFPTDGEGGYLVADRATLGADRVPLSALPLFARPDEPVEIVVGRRVTLRGSLRQYAVLGTGARADTSDVAGVPFAVIEALGAGVRYRAVSDLDGAFLFDDLAAGTYTLRVVQAPLPARHRLEQETITITVDDDAEVRWRVLPERAPIRLLNGGTLGGGGSLRLGEDDGDD